jgi:hypothetical protein
MRISTIIYMDMDFKDMAAIKEMMDDHRGGRWGQNTALWAIVAIILVIAFLWFCRKAGDDKADLAASVQGLYGRVNAIEPAVTAQGNAISELKSVTTATTQAVGDFKATALRNLAALDNAVFVSRCGDNHSCGCNDSRFIKKSVFTPSTTTVEQVETCG